MNQAAQSQVEQLAKQLRECDGFLRPKVAAQLQQLGPLAIDPLLPALSDPNWAVRYWAARILGSLGGPLAISRLELQVAIEEDNFVKQTMIEVLATFRPITGGLGRQQESPQGVRHREEEAFVLNTSPKKFSGGSKNPLHDAQLPPYSRQQLGWYQFEERKIGEWILVLKPYYAALFSRQQNGIMLKSHTGWRITKAGNNRYAYFRNLYLEDIASIRTFIEAYSSLVIIGLNEHIKPHFTAELDACIALDFNMIKRSSGEPLRTEVGELEYQAKYHQASAAIDTLSRAIAASIAWIPSSNIEDLYPSMKWCLTYIPPEPIKQFHLPRELARRIVSCIPQELGSVPTYSIVEAQLTGSKASLKNAPFEQKLAEWQRIIQERSISLSHSIQGYAVYLIDDLYQSGATMWTYAKYLKSIGADQVFGFVCVKSLRDTDNT